MEQTPWLGWGVGGGGGGLGEADTKCERCLKKTVGRTSLDYDELNTLLVETIGIINSRPLTCVYDDDESISQSYTIPFDQWPQNQRAF